MKTVPKNHPTPITSILALGIRLKHIVKSANAWQNVLALGSIKKAIATIKAKNGHIR